MTPCEMDSLRARGWKINGKSAAVFSPDCRPDGSYVPEQCDKSKGQCWCVDKKGNELAGTRADGRRTCTSQGGYKIGLNTSSQSLFSVILFFFFFGNCFSKGAKRISTAIFPCLILIREFPRKLIFPYILTFS